jgi:hypothetical protein
MTTLNHHFAFDRLEIREKERRQSAFPTCEDAREASLNAINLNAGGRASKRSFLDPEVRCLRVIGSL